MAAEKGGMNVCKIPEINDGEQILLSQAQIHKSFQFQVPNDELV